MAVQLIAKQNDLGAFVVGELFPGGMRRRLVHGCEDCVGFVLCFDELALSMSSSAWSKESRIIDLDLLVGETVCWFHFDFCLLAAPLFAR